MDTARPKEHAPNCAYNVPWPNTGACNCGGVLRADTARPASRGKPDAPALIARINEYFELGGLWNPEQVVPQRAVANLLRDCRTALKSLSAHAEPAARKE
jgi:hypothetical protein